MKIIMRVEGIWNKFVLLVKFLVNGGMGCLIIICRVWLFLIFKMDSLKNFI